MERPPRKSNTPSETVRSRCDVGTILWKSRVRRRRIGGQQCPGCGHPVHQQRSSEMFGKRPCARTLQAVQISMSPETGTEPGETPAPQQSRATDTTTGSSGLVTGIETQGPRAIAGSVQRDRSEAPLTHTQRGLTPFTGHRMTTAPPAHTWRGRVSDLAPAAAAARAPTRLCDAVRIRDRRRRSSLKMLGSLL